MKIDQLIKKLTKIKEKHGDILVILSNDDEGNGYHEAASPEVYKYHKGDNCIGPIELTQELINQGYTEGDLIQGGVLAVVL